MATNYLSAKMIYTVCLFDSVRQRPVPVAVYQPEKVNKDTRVIVFNHGYGVNAGDSYLTYSDIIEPLSAKGYFVISIQHELPADPLLPMEGDFMNTRMPNWQRGVENILFCLKEFKKLKPELDWDKLTVMGHSNGGDMAMLFATEYPQLVWKSISLDHRRMIMPRTGKPRIYSLRGCDYDADEGVLPSLNEQHRYHMTVIRLDHVRHGDMDNKGTQEQHEQMLDYLFRFLKE